MRRCLCCWVVKSPLTLKTSVPSRSPSSNFTASRSTTLPPPSPRLRYSITQGEQVAGVWKPLFDRFGIHIDFAHRTFRWDSEANQKAHVHCVIVGFSFAPNSAPRVIYSSDRAQVAENINAYLLNAPDIFLERRANPICDVPLMCKGSQPTDGGNLILSAEEYKDFIKQEPLSEKYIRLFLGAEEFLNGKKTILSLAFWNSATRTF